MLEKKTTQKALSALFISSEQETLTKKGVELKVMFEDVYSKWISNPGLSDKRLSQYIMNKFSRSKSQSYTDIAMVKEYMGNVGLASKEFQRYRVVEMLLNCYEKAKHEGDIKAMIMAVDKLGKYTKLDKDEPEEIPWDQIVPPVFEPSCDPTILNIPNIPQNTKDLNAWKKRLRDKYIKSSDFLEAEIISIED